MAGSNSRVDLKEDRIVTAYEYEGSAVRKFEELPKRKHKDARETEIIKKRALRRYSVSLGYVVFIAMVCVAVSMLCVIYLNQKATITAQYESMAVLESQYSELKNNNDAKYNQVIDSVSLEDVKDAAQNRLGMSYATAEQIIYYTLEDNSYVRQYKDVPTE